MTGSPISVLNREFARLRRLFKRTEPRTPAYYDRLDAVTAATQRKIEAIASEQEARAVDPVASEASFRRLAEALRESDREGLKVASSRKSRPHGGRHV